MSAPAQTWTYEVGTAEPLHPDPDVTARMREVALGPCGCKVYADPRSAVRVLAHNSAYGCNGVTPQPEPKPADLPRDCEAGWWS